MEFGVFQVTIKEGTNSGPSTEESIAGEIPNRIWANDSGGNGGVPCLYKYASKGSKEIIVWHRQND